MSNFNSPQMPLDSDQESQPTADQKDHADAINSEIFPTTAPTEVNDPPTSIEISVTPENDPATSRDWFNLARKLRGQNKELLESIVKLEQALAESQQQLQEQGRQARRNDSFVTQQTAQINHIKAQFQAAQEKSEQQQLKLTTLQEQLTTTQSQLAQVERQCTLLKQRYQDKANQLNHSQKQLEELETRLQRQQRYALQYKAALDECLSKSGRKQVPPPITSPGSVNTRTSNITSIKTWSEPLKTPNESESVVAQEQPKDPLTKLVSSQTSKTPIPSPSIDPIDQTLEELFSLAPEMPEAMKDKEVQKEKMLNSEPIEPPSDNLNPQTIANQNSHSQEIIPQTSQTLALQSRAPFSFHIDPNKPRDKGKIDLPSFLRRRSH